MLLVLPLNDFTSLAMIISITAFPNIIILLIVVSICEPNKCFGQKKRSVERFFDYEPKPIK